MESNIKASFIPDKMPNTRRGDGRSAVSSGGGAGDIFILIAIVTLAAVLALAAGVFLYDKFLTASVDKKNSQLQRAQKSFDQATIKELLRIDSRLQASDAVLANHLAPSELFNILEELTLKSIEYSSLEYSVGENGTIALKLSGKARSVNGVALQASIFGQHNAIINPIFSNLDLVKDGVTFDVSATINPTALRYITTLSENSDNANYTATSSNSTGNLLNSGVEPSVSPTNSNTNPNDFGGFGNEPINKQ